MVRIWFRMLRIIFECFEFFSNDSNLHSNALNPFWMVRICIWMLRIPFEWLEFAFECFESLSNGSNLNSNASNLFEWFEFAFECYQSFWIVRIFHLNASNPFRMVRICISTLRIPFEWFEFAFECFEYLSNGSNLHSIDSNHFSNCLNLHLNALNPLRMVRICFWMLRIPF